MRDWLWDGRPWRAFKNFAIIFSFIVNIILLLLLLLTAPILIPALNSIAKPLVGGLSDSFVQMGEARIRRTIEVDDQIPVQFTLPLEQETTVVLNGPVPLSVPATFNLPADGGTINGQVSLTLPPGLELPIALSMDVPVSNTLPVQLNVAVDIPLSETELAGPFRTLEGLFLPLDRFMQRLPENNDDLWERVTRRPPVPERDVAATGIR